MNKLDEMELLCSLAIKSEPVIKRINSIFEDRVRKVGLDEIEKYNTEATEKVCQNSKSTFWYLLDN